MNPPSDQPEFQSRDRAKKITVTTISSTPKEKSPSETGAAELRHDQITVVPASIKTNWTSVEARFHTWLLLGVASDFAATGLVLFDIITARFDAADAFLQLTIATLMLKILASDAAASLTIDAHDSMAEKSNRSTSEGNA